jgi:hypothetical protein
VISLYDVKRVLKPNIIAGTPWLSPSNTRTLPMRSVYGHKQPNDDDPVVDALDRLSEGVTIADR